jgi:CheY-like chemotaxis protein
MMGASDPTLPLRGRTLLVIEDHDDTREGLRRLLDGHGATVMVSADGRAGLRHLAQRVADAVLCDLALPEMDGLEFATRVRADSRYRRVLLIAVTDRASPADFLETWTAGFDAHLVKPVTAEMLAALARRLADRAERGLATGT